MSPLLAQSGHPWLQCKCPLLGGKADMAIAVCLLLTESQNFSSRPVLLFFEEGLGALRQFCWCNVFLMRCNVPTVSERVRNSTAAVTVEHIHRFHNFCAASFERLLKNAVHIWNI